MTDWAIGGPHISTEHNRRDQKGLVMIKHPVTKNSAKEEPQNCMLKNEGLQQRKIIFHTFKNIFYNSMLLSFTKIIVFFQCFTVMLTKV